MIDSRCDSFRQTEFIIVDSSEDPDQFIFRTNYKYLKIENRGPSFARNRGVEIASGTWVLFCDGDDFINPGIEHFLISKVDLDMFDAYFFPFKRLDDLDFLQLATFPPTYPSCFQSELIKSNVFFLQHFFPVHAVLIKRSVFENNKFDEELWLIEDVRFYLELQNSELKLASIVNGLCLSSYHRDFRNKLTLSRSNNAEFWKSVCLNYKFVIKNAQLTKLDKIKLIYLTAINYHSALEFEIKQLLSEELIVIWSWFFGLPKILRSKMLFQFVYAFVNNRKSVFVK